MVQQGCWNIVFWNFLRRSFHTGIFLWKNFRMMKFLYGKGSSRRNFLTEKFFNCEISHGKIPHGENSSGEVPGHCIARLYPSIRSTSRNTRFLLHPTVSRKAALIPFHPPHMTSTLWKLAAPQTVRSMCKNQIKIADQF